MSSKWKKQAPGLTQRLNQEEQTFTQRQNRALRRSRFAILRKTNKKVRAEYRENMAMLTVKASRLYET